MIYHGRPDARIVSRLKEDVKIMPYCIFIISFIVFIIPTLSFLYIFKQNLVEYLSKNVFDFLRENLILVFGDTLLKYEK